MTVIESERLRLRLPEPDEAAEVCRYFRENAEHLQPWAPTWPSDMLTEEHWREQLQRAQAELKAGTAYRFFVFTRAAPEVVAGTVSLTSIIRGSLQQCFLGYSLAAREQGHGYITEAVEAAVQFAFEELQLHRVAAGYMPENARSAAVLRRCGFRVEGYAYDYLLLDGRWRDHILTARTKPEQPPLTPR